MAAALPHGNGLGFESANQVNGLYMAGVMLTNIPTSREIFYAVFNPEIGTWTGLIPQAG